MAHIPDEGLQVVLQGIAGDPEKHIDQAVIANFSQKGLLVGKRVGSNNLRRRVRYFDGDQIRSGNNADELAELEAILTFTRKLDTPLPAFGSRGDDLGRQCGSEPERIDSVAQILRERDAERFGDLDELVAREIELGLAGLVVFLKNGPDDGRIAIRLLRGVGDFLLSHWFRQLGLRGSASESHPTPRRNVMRPRTSRTTTGGGRPAPPGYRTFWGPGKLREP